MNKSFAFSGAAFSILVLLLTLLANLSKITALVAISQLAPLITVMLLLIVLPGRKEALKQLGIAKIGGLKWYAAALLSIVPITVGFLGAWAFGIVDLPSAEFLAKGAAHFTVPQYVGYITRNSWAPIMLIMMFIFSFGEEIGWRGYLQPRLTKAFGIKKSILITAAVWTCFHYPFYLNGYNEDGNVWINILLFSVMIFPLSVFMGWIRWRSQSVWLSRRHSHDHQFVAQLAGAVVFRKIRGLVLCRRRKRDRDHRGLGRRCPVDLEETACGTQAEPRLA